jgi:hypothetical protein
VGTATARTINLDGRWCTVVGILPEHHRTLIGFGYSPDVFLPQYLDSTILAIYARLKPGMSIPAARAGVVTVANRLDAEDPSRFKYADGVRVSPIAGYARLRSQPELLAVGAPLLTVAARCRELLTGAEHRDKRKKPLFAEGPLE